MKRINWNVSISGATTPGNTLTINSGQTVELLWNGGHNVYYTFHLWGGAVVPSDDGTARRDPPAIRINDTGNMTPVAR